MGRHKKPASEIRNVIFELALTQKEKERLVERAELLGMSQSDLMRFSVFGKRSVRVDPEKKKKMEIQKELFAPALRDLDGIGNNINQIAKAVNTTVLAGDNIDVHSVGSKLLRLLREMENVELRISNSISYSEGKEVALICPSF